MKKKINLSIFFFLCILLHGNAYGSLAKTGRQVLTKTPTVMPRTPTRKTGIEQPSRTITTYSPGNIPSASKTFASEKTQRKSELKREQGWGPEPEGFVISESSEELGKSYAQERLKNDIPYFKNLIQQARDVGFGPESLKQFEDKIDIIETAEDLSLKNIQILSKGFEFLKSVIKTKNKILELADLIQKAKSFPENQIDLEPYEELTQALMHETMLENFLNRKDEVATQLLKLKQSVRRLEKQETEKKEKQAAEQERKLIEAFAEETAEEKTAREVKEAQEKTEKPAPKPLKVKISKTIIERPTQEFTEQLAQEEKAAKKEELRLAEETAQLKALEELALKEKEELETELATEKTKLEKDIHIKNEIEEQITTHQEEQKQLELQQGETTNKTEQENLHKEMKQNKTETEKLEQKIEEKTTEIERQTETIKKDEAVLEEKTAEIESIKSQKEVLEKEIETIQKQQLQSQELGQAKLKQQTEQLSSQELGKAKLEQEPIKETKEQQKEEQKEERKTEEKKEEQEKKKAEEKTERNESGNIPTKKEIEPIKKSTTETAGEEQKQPVITQKKPSSIPQKEESKETEAILPQITPTITTAQPKKEIAPTIEETMYQPVEPSFAPSFAESFGGHGKATEGRPTGITPRRPTPRPSAYSPQIPTSSAMPSYGTSGGTPSSAESIGGSSLSPINPYTGRIEVQKPVVPKEKVPVQETKIEKKVQPGEQVWWEKLLPKWMVQYLGRKDRTIQKKAAVEKPLLRSTSSEGQATEKPAKEASIIETIVETIKKPVANAISYIRELLGVS